MREALALADEAAVAGEVPVGAVVVLNDVVVGRGRNAPIASCDPTAHAEVTAIRGAAARLGKYRLVGATLYVTLEPCMMCVGAIAHARIDTLVYGVPETRSGAIESNGRLHAHPSLNHQPKVISGVLAAECRQRLQQFFAARRKP
jgi:tRNA(adenine34) deaminase